MWGGRAGALLRAWGFWPAGALGRRPPSCHAASPAGSSPARCWNCGSPAGPVRKDGLFCQQCRALQPPDPAQDYFSLLDCNRSFRVDTAKLQHRYQQLQRLVHPDFFSQRSQLKLHGVDIPEGTDYEMDRQFLMEIMEINEKLAEIQSEAAVKEIESIVRAKQKELTDNVSRAFEQGDRTDPLTFSRGPLRNFKVSSRSRKLFRNEFWDVMESVKDDFEKAKEILTKMKYFSNVEEQIKLKKIPL